MRRFITMKTLITTGVIAYFLYIFAVTWFQIGTQYSSDAAAGFMMGLIYMGGLFLVVKSVRYLYNDFSDWLIERKRKRAREKILSCEYEEN